MTVSSLRSWRDSCARGAFLAAELPQKACSKAARENLNLHNAPPPKKDAALLLILPATQARPYVRRKIVEMQKWWSHGNLISHLSSPNHNYVYLNWDSKSVMNCWFLKEKTRHFRHLLQNLRGLHTSKLLLLLWKASLHEIYSHENVDILVWISMHCGKTFTPPLVT